MFQTEPNLWMQSFDSAFLIELMNLISDLGYAPVYIVLLFAFSFGVRLREGLAVLVSLMICVFMTETLKESIAFPRPDDIDSRVMEPGEEPPVPIIDTGGAPTFFALPPAEAVEAVRDDPESGSYGIPSGHTSAAAAFFFGLAFFFRSHRLLAFACFWVTVMASSRMYLGRHFLGDVLCGAGVGIVAVLGASLCLRTLQLNQARSENLRSLVPLTGLATLILLLMPFVTTIEAQYAGMLWAGVVAYGFLALSRLPSNDGTTWQRTGRVCLSLLLFVAVSLLLSQLTHVAGWKETTFTEFVVNLVVMSTAICGTIAISRYLRWYRREVAEYV